MHFQIKVVHSIDAGGMQVERANDVDEAVAMVTELLRKLEVGRTSGWATHLPGGGLKVERVPSDVAVVENRIVHAIIVTPIAVTVEDVLNPKKLRKAEQREDHDGADPE